MDFYTINQQKHYEIVASAIVGRELELYHYDLNITNYEAMLLVLPQGDWPENLAQYQKMSAEGIPHDVHDDVINYQYRDRLSLLLKTEKAERNKTYLVYQALLSQLPEDQKEALIAAAHEKIQALQ